MDCMLLSQLTLQQQVGKIKVKICGTWESTAPFLKGYIFNLDYLLVDEKVGINILYTFLFLYSLFF